MWTSLRVKKNSKGTYSWPHLHFCEFYLQKSYQNLIVKTEKSLLLLAGPKESSHFESHAKHSAIFNKACTLRKLFHQRLTLLEFYQNLTDLGEVLQMGQGKYPTTDFSNHPAPPK